MSRAPHSVSNAEVHPTSWGDAVANEASSEATLGSYRLLDLLAVGEHCSVHRARSCVAPAGDVVIKRLRHARQRSSRARLLREARIGLGLTDRHLVRVLALHDEPELYVVTQLVEGATLAQLLREQLGLDALRFALPMLVDVLHGLSALHQWRTEEGAPSYLVHQAVRARHILAGDDGVTRLIDLGDVHGSPFSGSAPRLPRQDGVEVYAPEQFDASQGLDPRCDVFLTGCVLHDLLTQLGAAPGATWGALHGVAERARSPKRSARFWSAEEMAFTLQNAAIEAGVFASRPQVGAWVQAVRAGVPTDSSRSSGVRLRVAPALTADSAARTPSEDDDELGFDVRTTAWERPLDPASLPPDLQVLLNEEAPARTLAPPAAPDRPPAAAPRSPLPANTPALLLRDAPNPGSWQRWAAALALAGVGFGLAALAAGRTRMPPPAVMAPASAPQSPGTAPAPAPTVSSVPGAPAAPTASVEALPPAVAPSAPAARVSPVTQASRPPARAAAVDEIGAADEATDTRARPRAALPQNPY